MTIAAGFLCRDGIVLAADTEYTANAKFQGTKIWCQEADDTALILAGAGPAVSLGYIRDRIFRLLTPSMKPEAIADMVEDVLHRFFTRYVPQGKAEDAPSLLFGIRYEQDFHLYQTAAAPPPAKVDRWACVGWGGDLGQYLADLFYRPEESVAYTECLAAYVVYQAKLHSAYCGGKTDIVSLTTNELTPMIRPRRERIAEMERYFDSFHVGFGSLLSVGSDLSLSDDLVDRRLKRFDKWVRQWRQSECYG